MIDRTKQRKKKKNPNFILGIRMAEEKKEQVEKKRNHPPLLIPMEVVKKKRNRSRKRNHTPLLITMEVVKKKRNLPPFLTPMEEEVKPNEEVVKKKRNRNRNSRKRNRSRKLKFMGDNTMSPPLLSMSNRNNRFSDLHNLAWIQAVENKPFNEIIMLRDFESTKNQLNPSLMEVKNNDSSICEENVRFGGWEKEEGELEEGEIECDLGEILLEKPIEIPLQSCDSTTTTHMNSLSGQGLFLNKTMAQLGSGFQPVPILQAPIISRDPRLVNPLKRQRDGTYSWLEDNNNVGFQFSNANQLMENMETYSIGKRQDTGLGKFNFTSGGNEQLSVTSTEALVSLPNLLKEIVTDPTILTHLIKNEQQRLTPEARRTERPHMSAQTTAMSSQVEGEKFCMKPRDPRRILHSNTFQSCERLGPEQFKVKEASPSSSQVSKDNLIVRQQGEWAETNSLPSQSAPPPDIAMQFTKNLKSIADVLSTSKSTNIPPLVPRTISSPPIPVKTDKPDVSAIVAEANDQRNKTRFVPEESTTVPSQCQNMWGDVEHLMKDYNDQQKATIQGERARRIDEQKKMFANRKLSLVLDLDLTLLNSVKFVEVDPVLDEILRKKEEEDRKKPQRHLFRFPYMGLWTKLRPGIWNFLEKASKLYEMHIYTMGNKQYATEMAKVLDPTGVLFAGRVISKGSDRDLSDGDERLPKTKNLDGVLGLESAVVIVDDTVQVWPQHKLNLINVERYTYFPHSRRQFGLLGPSLLEIDHDERLENGTLASSLAVMERIHQNFFSHQDLNNVDVRNILASEQRRILAGCRILFSRVIPVGEANPHLHPLWQTAEQFGAVCVNQIDDKVTHVVTLSLGTEKVNWALSTGRFVVSPGWVEASSLLYRRANELYFPIKLKNLHL